MQGNDVGRGLFSFSFLSPPSLLMIVGIPSLGQFLLPLILLISTLSCLFFLNIVTCKGLFPLKYA